MKKLFIGEELRTLQQKLADEKESESLMKRAEAGMNINNWKLNPISKNLGEKAIEKAHEKCVSEKCCEKIVAEKNSEKYTCEKALEYTFTPEDISLLQQFFNVHTQKGEGGSVFDKVENIKTSINERLF